MGRKKTRYSELNIKIGQRIKEERLRLGLSCQKLADRLVGYESGNSVLYWEQGTGVPIDVISKLADVFNVRVEYLICKDDFREKYHHMMTAKETEAWYKFTQSNLIETLNERDHYRFELEKALSRMELSNGFEKESPFYLDGVKLSKQELQILKTLLEGIRSNRKAVDNL